VRIQGAWCETDDGERTTVSRQGAHVTVCIRVAFARELQDPEFTLNFRNEHRHTILVVSTRTLDESTGHFDAGESVTLRFGFVNWLAPSRYTVTAAIGDERIGFEAYGRAEDVAALIVQAPHHTGGVVDVPFELEVERG
jgi:hypothetical protein